MTFCLVPMKLGSKHVEIKILANSQNRTRIQMNIISIKRGAFKPKNTVECTSKYLMNFQTLIY